LGLQCKPQAFALTGKQLESARGKPREILHDYQKLPTLRVDTKQPHRSPWISMMSPSTTLARPVTWAAAVPEQVTG
jgi:hypothetical protein